MIGELLAILSALIWALSSVFYKIGLKDMKPTTINTIRPLVALCFLTVVLLLSGDAEQILDLSLKELSYILLATLFGLVIGDLLYLFSLKAIGIARAYPVSNTYPIFTLVLAPLFLEETISAKLIVGAVMIVAAIFLLSEKRFDLEIRKGIFLAVGASFFWATSMTIMKVAMSSISPLVFSTLRMAIFASFLLFYTVKYEKIEFFHITKSWGIVALGGIFDLGIGILLFLTALKHIDVSKASPLNGTAPIFAVMFALLLTNEKITVRILLGVVLSFLGVLVIV